MADAVPLKIRTDKWLWYARIAKSRSLAQTLIKTGKVRVNAQKITSPSRAIGPEDVLTIAKGRQVFVLKVLDCGTRRGPAPEAQALYEDMSPPPPPKETKPARPAQREEGAGRPTKRERRMLDKLRPGIGD